MASVYIMYSETSDKFYIGSTKNIKERIEYHLSKEFASSFTAKYSDWKLFFEINDLTITQARQIEAHIKKMKSRKYILDLKKHPEISQKLLKKYY